jgi:hypothetical protein
MTSFEIKTANVVHGLERLDAGFGAYANAGSPGSHREPETLRVPIRYDEVGAWHDAAGRGETVLKYGKRWAIDDVEARVVGWGCIRSYVLLREVV